MNHTLARTAAALLLATSAAAQAQAIDLSTASGLGDALISSSSATLTTAYVDASDPVGSEAGGTGGSALWIDTLESAIPVASGTLGLDALEGSALSLSFSLAASGSIGFNWSLSTLGYDASFADRAFVLIDGQLATLATVAGSTLTGSFSSALLASGSHTLTLGVVDVVDTAGVSSLTVSGLAVTAAVPEPAGYALMLAGLAGVGLVARRRR